MESTLAAQYLRVSTERQEYSLEFQNAGIAAYAAQHNFSICQTYVDEAKSGLDIKRRNALSQLLRDVLGGKHPYKAILVYDVSRWGRFQDPDEAAAYEFLCKAAGVHVHYCAEHFRNDGYLPNIILKVLKRVMAGEYSRELSEKVFAGQSRVAKNGFRAGGEPGYGYRRMLISTNNTPKGEIPAGERKSLSTERVKLVPGPDNEVRWVREIYRMYVAERRSMQAIAKELNRLEIPYVSGRKWTDGAVRGILTNPKYTGTCRFNRTSGKLKSSQKLNPKTEWIVVPNAFAPIIEPSIFEAAQEVWRNKPWNLSDEEVLQALRSVLEKEGKLSIRLLRGIPKTMTRDSYARRFGSLTQAYELVGYHSPRKSTIAHRAQIRKVRMEVMDSLVRLFPDEVSILSRGPGRRNCLRLKNGTRVAVRACRCKLNKYKGPTWVLQGARKEKQLISLLIALNAENNGMEFAYVLPPIANRCPVAFSREHSWFKKGVRLDDPSSFCDAAKHMKGKQPIGGGKKPKWWISEDARAVMTESQRLRWAAKRKSLPILLGDGGH